jgi:hypothetical protein
MVPKWRDPSFEMLFPRVPSNSELETREEGGMDPEDVRGLWVGSQLLRLHCA